MNASLQADNSAWVCLCVSAQCYSRALLSVQLTLRLAVGTPCRRSWHNGRTVTALISLGYDSYLCGRLVHLSSHRPATLRQTPVAFQVGSVYRSIYFTYLDVFFFCSTEAVRKALCSSGVWLESCSAEYWIHRTEKNTGVRRLNRWNVCFYGDICAAATAVRCFVPLYHEITRTESLLRLVRRLQQWEDDGAHVPCLCLCLWSYCGRHGKFHVSDLCVIFYFFGTHLTQRILSPRAQQRTRLGGVQTWRLITERLAERLCWHRRFINTVNKAL